MISFYPPSSWVSSFPSVVLLYLAFLSADRSYISSSPVSSDDAPRGNDERSSYMRCRLHTLPYTQTYEESDILSHLRDAYVSTGPNNRC